MKAAQVSDYVSFARDLVAAVPDRHISFEVFSDAIPEMVAQARVISAWGANVYAKLPVTTTRSEPLFEAVRALSHDGIKVNLTAICSPDQVRTCLRVGICRASRRCRRRLSADHARRHRAGTLDDECRDYLGVDPRGLQRGRGG
jgi:transaldolase